MRILKKFFPAVILILIVVSFALASAYGKTVKSSFWDNVEFDQYLKKYGEDLRVQSDTYPYDEDYDLYGGGEKIQNFKELTKNSDLIVRGKLSSGYERKIFSECIFSEVEILKCYKGNVKQGDSIHLFEPVNCTGFGNPMLCEEGYLPMTENQEYILFLRKVKNSHFSSDQYIYLPVSITYGKYKADTSFPKRYTAEQISVDTSNEKHLLKYKDVKNEEVIIYENERYKSFLKFKANVIRKFL